MPLRAPTPDEVESLRQQGVDVDRLPDKLQFGDDDSQMSVGRAALSTLSAHKGGILGGGVGAIGTGAALAGLGLAPFTAGLSLPISLLGLGAVGVGAAGAGYLGQKSQEALEGEEKTKQLQLEAARAASQHPIVSAVTDITAGALASGGWPSPTTPIRAGVGAVRGLLGRGISAAEKSALQNVAIQGAINPAINVGISAATTGQLPSLGEVGQQALGGALFAGHGPLSRIGGRPTEPVGETHAKDNPTVTEEVPTPVRSSIFTQTDVNGLPLLDDTAVQHAFKQANPKPDTTNLGKVEAYAAETQWRNKNRLSVEEKRDMLHTAFLEQQDKQAAITPTETKPEPTPEVLATQPVVNDPKLTDFLKARQEVATQNVVPPPILTHENKQPPEIVQPNVPVGKPITANQARIINPDTLLQPDINRPQTPLSDETATETGVDKNKYYPSSKGEMDQYSKQKEILQTKLDNVNKILEDHSKVTQNLMDQQSSPERNKSLETANATLGSLQKTQSDLQQRLVNVEQAFNESNKPLRFIGEKGTREGDQILVTRDPVTEKWRTTYFGKPTSLEERMNIGQMVPLGHEVHESKSEAIKWATGGEYAKHKFTEIPYDSPEAAFAPSSDFTRYNELQNIIGHHILSKTYDSPELYRAFAESESIKNRNKGMPPKAETQLTVGTIIENAKGSPKVDDHVNLISELKIDKEAADVPVIVSKELTTDINQRSRYDIMHDRIILKPEDAGDPSIVAHEILHAAIYKKLPSEFNGVRGYKLEHQMDKYLQSGKDENVKELIRSYRETAKQLGIYNELFGTVEAGKVVSKGLAGLPDRAAKKLVHGYAMGDLHEFVSEAISNPLFQNHLNELPSGLKEDGTMWSRFTDAIRRILGVGVKHNSMLERVLRPIDELAQQERSGNVREGIAQTPERRIKFRESNKKVEDIVDGQPFYEDEDGGSWWINLKDGWTVDGSTAIHERTKQKAFERAKDATYENPNINKENKYAPPKKTRGIEETRKGGFVGGAFRATIDKIRDIPHPAAGDVANAFHNVLVGRQEYIGKQLNPILQKGNGLTKVQDDRLALAARYEVENKKSGEFLLRTDKEKAVFRQEKASLKANFEERLKNEEPVLRNGRPTMPVRDEFYHPTTPNPKVVQVYRNGTDTAEIGRLDKVFVDYQKQLGLKSTEIKENLATWKQGVQRSANDSNSMGNQQFFNAARRAQGVPLPPEFTRPGFMKNVEAYFHRQATDNAYYKYVEDNPKVMSALGESMDAWRRPIDQHPQGSIAGNPAVRAQLNEIKGEVGGAGYHNEKAVSSLATTLFIGPGTTIHKALSNFVGLTNYADNPYQLGKMLGSIVTNASKGLEHATENGVVKLTARSLKDLWAGNITGAERLQALAHTVRGIYSLGDLTDRWGAGLMQAGLEGVLPNKITQANKGDVTNQQLLRRVDPSYNIGKTYTDEGISKLASALVGSIHGTGDGRTMPPWMTGDSELSGFFKLSNWGISQTNRFMSDIYTPAMRGDVQPLLTGLFGAAVGGYLIKELREKLQGKRGQIPSLSEIANSSQGLEGNKGLLAYNLMASLSYAGFGGMLTTIGKIPIDWAYKNNAQGAVFPLDEISTDLAHTLGQVSTAIANDPNINWLHLTEQVAQHFLTTNIQLGRVAYNQMVDNGLITGSLAEKKALSDKLGQLRRFDIVEGLPYDEQDQQGNPYINIEQKRFKQTQDVGEAMKELPQLITNIMDKYHDKPDIMLEKIKALKQNTYATFPSMESTPISFMKYIGFLNREEGPDKAHDALVDYMRHKMINEAKASVVP